MAEGFRCTRCGFEHPAIAALSEALLQIGRERSVPATLHRIAEAVRVLGDARLAAVALLDEHGSFARLVIAGSDEAVADAVPAAGLLRVVIDEGAPVRIPDLSQDPRGDDLPAAFGVPTSFLGVPLVAGDRVIAAFFLFDRAGAPSFTASDQEAVQMLAWHAVLAIENAHLNERSRELTVVEERNRLARELHDAVSQTLFSIVLISEVAGELLDRDTAAAKDQIVELRRLAQDAQQEMRSLIFELRPADIERDGLTPTLRKHLEVLGRVYPVEIELSVSGERRLAPEAERELFRVAQEALSNALKHAGAQRVTVGLDLGGGARLRVSDDGKGFDPARLDTTARRFGLTSMRERAEGLGGTFEIESREGAGTTVSVEVPDGR